MIRVLIVEDSAFAAEILTGILQSDPDIQVIGVARDGVEAVEMTPRLKPDLITMDVWMPQMDGFATVEQVMAYHPTPILVVTTSLARTDVDISLTMLAAGALDVIEKPSRLGATPWEQQTRALIRKVKLLARVRVVTHLRGRRGGRPTAVAHPAAPPPVAPVVPNGGSAPAAPEVPLDYALRREIGQRAAPPPPTERPVTGSLDTATPPPPRRDSSEAAPGARRNGPAASALDLPPHRPGQPGLNRYSLLAIASSTGGPQALLTLLRALPAAFPLPIVVVQHIAAGFTQGLADWLARECRRPVACAADGDQPTPGAVLLAPDAHHLLLGADGRVRLATSARAMICPAADVMMESVAEVYEARAIGVILTGMGRDGADGMKVLRLAGGYTIAQDEQSSIIFGMPRAAIGLGIIDEVLPLEHIAPRLEQLVAGRAP